MSTTQFKAACIQMTSGDEVAGNLHTAERLCQQAAADGARLVVLPEFFPLLAKDETLKRTIAEDDSGGKIQTRLAALARACDIYLVGGTIPLRSGDAARVYSSCLVYAPSGERLARYDKIHLFHFSGQQQSYAESQTIMAGETQAAVVDTPLGKVGLSVCYDLRFPELYRAMGEVDVIVAPSAFTCETGERHWQLLLQARAVENQAYVLGAAQAGQHPGGRTTYGHSMVVDAWGDICAAAKTDGDEVILATIDHNKTAAIRQRLPALKNRQIF